MLTRMKWQIFLEVMQMAKSKRYPWPAMPPDVGQYVADQMARDWEELARPCREVCQGCPADRDGETSPCMNCPFSGLSTLAATVTLASKMIRLKDAHDKNKI